jgi:hypothetical protein
MTSVNRLIIAAWIAWIASPTVGIGAQPSGELEIRNPAGMKLIAANQIRFYDWGTHTLTLTAGTREKLLKELKEGHSLASGTLFIVFVGDEPIYRGQFNSIESSRSFDSPTIVIDRSMVNPNLAEEELQIELGYPTKQFFKGDDPRSDRRIRAALQESGKLSRSIERHTAWITASLLEMKSIKQGMTRAQLLEAFREEGGLSTRRERRYAYRDCPYIKVDVKFNPAAETPADKTTEDPRDTISQISQPFLEWSIMD